VACSLQDMIRLQLQRESNLDHFDEKFVVQLNDTHPSIAVAELMRLLVDEYAMEWEHGLGDHPQDLRLYQPHAAARGAREMATGRCSSACCRGISRSSARSTSVSSTMCAFTFRAMTTGCGGCR
jgi:hypothetical protein